MSVSLTAEQEAFRRYVCDFLKTNWNSPVGTHKVPAAVRADDDETYEIERQLRRQLGERGLLALGWPEEFGGQGRSTMEQYIFAWEMSYHGIPYSNTATGIVGPTLMAYGSDEQKREFLSRIARGEVEFCLGYTEPNAGSDLASLALRAERDGDEYIINGQKVFTSGAHRAEFVWLAARTDPSAPKHRGISLFIVDLKSPGISIRELKTLGDHRTNEVFYDNVRVPARNLVGEPERGWHYMTKALDHERVNIYPVASQIATLEILVKLLDADGRLSDPIVANQIGTMVTKLQGLKLLSMRNAWLVSDGLPLTAQASVLKVVSSEVQCELADLSVRLLGLSAVCEDGAASAENWQFAALGQFDRWAAMPKFAGGSNEIMKNIIATRTLGLPRS